MTDISVVTVASASENTERWLFDSAASASLTSNKELLRDYHEITPIAVGGFGQSYQQTKSIRMKHGCSD